MDGESGDGDGDDFTHMNSLTGLHEARSYCIVLYCIVKVYKYIQL